MKAIKFLFILAAGLFIFNSCSKAIEEATSINVPVPDFNVEIPVNVTAPSNAPAFDLRSSTAPNHFKGSATLNIDRDDFKDLKKYLKNITGFKLGTAEVKVNISTGDHAENVVLSSADVTGTVTIQNISFTGTFYSSPELTAYATKLFQKFIDKGEISVSIEGDTNYAGGTLIILVHFGDLKVTAKIL